MYRFDGHHFGGSSFDMIFLLCYKMWAIPTGTSSVLKKKSGKESQYLVSRSGLGSDPPIGSGRDSGCNTSWY